MRLRVTIDGQAVHTFTVDRAIPIGRAPSNGLVLQAPDISAHHALIYPEADGIWVRDLGSSNGTTVNGEAIHAPTPLTLRDVVGIGHRTRLEPIAATSAAPWTLHGEWVAVPVLDEQVGIPGTSSRLVMHDTGWEVLGPEGARSVEENVPFLVEGARFELVCTFDAIAPTYRMVSELPYCLRVDLDEASALLTEPTTERRVRMKSNLRSALLYALGEAWIQADHQPDLAWMTDADLQSKVWGILARNQGPNNLNVLVHRVRASVQRGGLDPGFLEKHQGRTRLVLENVELTP